MAMNGTVKFYNRKQDFGFITGDDGKEYYFNGSGMRALREKDSVSFTVHVSTRGESARDITAVVTPQVSRNMSWVWGIVALIVGMVIGHFI